MASTDARPIPLKNTAYRVTFPIMDEDGDLVTGAAGLDSEVSKDGGAFADCTSEATEIATNSGVYYLDLTSTEMNADTVAIIVKSSTTGAKTTVIVLYPEEAGDIRVNLTQIAGAAVSTSSAQLGVNVVQAAGTAWGSGAITSGAFATGAITAGAIAADAIGASELAADAVAEIADAVWDEARSGHTTAGSFGEGVVVNSVATGAITAGAIAADAIGASELAADAATEIGTAVWATAARTLTAATNLTSTGAAVPITAGGLVSADVTAISTDTTAANNAESFFDGTGYAGTNNVIPSVTTVGSVTGNVGGSVGSLAAQAKADVNAEVVDALATDTYAEPSSVPPATSSIAAKIGFLFAGARNKRQTTATTDAIRNDADSAAIGAASLTDDGTTFTRGEYS